MNRAGVTYNYATYHLLLPQLLERMDQLYAFLQIPELSSASKLSALRTLSKDLDTTHGAAHFITPSQRNGDKIQEKVRNSQLHVNCVDTSRSGL